MNITRRIISIILTILFTSTLCFGQADSDKEKSRTLPFAKTWFDDKEISLPLPFGVSAFSTYMSRDVDITNVEVAFLDQPKQSINDFTNFDLNNKNTVTAVKVDAWLLPFVNVYGLLGYVSTNASLDATITIDRVIFPGPPIIIPMNNQSKMNGSYLGLGTTMVAGYGSWFVLGDVNYAYSKLDELDSEIDFWMFSGRTGFQSFFGKNTMRAWVGGMYLSSHRTLHLNIQDDNLGLVEVDVYQETHNPLTLQLGASIGIVKHFEILTELGTNFDDASMIVLTGTYRF